MEKELMKPRYKVIADYPHNPYKVGELVETSLKVPYPSFLCTETSCEDIDGRLVACGSWIQLTEINKYPHLLKKLEWWEERKPEEMPEYLSHTIYNETTYHKIIKWDLSNPNFIMGYEDEKQGCNLGMWAKDYNYQPATETDYLNYIKTKTP